MPEYAIDRMYEKMKIAYYQLYEEIPNENIIDIINSKSIFNYKNKIR